LRSTETGFRAEAIVVIVLMDLGQAMPGIQFFAGPKK
jgi:hypothetical protein